MRVTPLRVEPAPLLVPRLLTIPQAAVYLNRSVKAVRHMVSRGKIPTVRDGRRVFIEPATLERWIRKHALGFVASLIVAA